MELNYRQAGLDDLACLVQMLANDSLGANRESAAMGMLDSYQQAFEHISGDPNNELVVVELDEVIVASLQMTYIPYLTYQGSWRALIEGVRVHQDYRSRGIGKLVFTWALEQARKRGCNMVQLTSDKRRSEAIRFYENLGFKASHEGFKYWF